MDGLFTPLNKEMNTDTCQQREDLFGDGKFQCVVSVTPGVQSGGRYPGEDQVEAEVGFCEPSPECGNAALPDDPCKVTEYFGNALGECGYTGCTGRRFNRMNFSLSFGLKNKLRFHFDSEIHVQS